MAKLHGLTVSLSDTDRPNAHLRTVGMSFDWFTLCDGVAVFMPDDDGEAVAYLDALMKLAVEMRYSIASRIADASGDDAILDVQPRVIGEAPGQSHSL